VTFSDPEISNVCSNGSTRHVVALMRRESLSDSEGARGRQSKQTLDDERSEGSHCIRASHCTRCEDPLFSEIVEERFDAVRKHILQLEQEAAAERG
jgi:hypothetical protein